LYTTRLDRQADCLHNQFKHLESILDLTSNNNYDKKCDVIAERIVEKVERNGKAGIYAKKAISEGTKICNYMGYLVDPSRPRHSLACSVAIVAPDNIKTENCLLLGIPNTIGSMINQGSKDPDGVESSNCTFQMNKSKFKPDSLIIPPDWITIVALRDITKGEELTIDYGSIDCEIQDESCTICFGRHSDNSHQNAILLCDGVINNVPCKTEIHVHCALMHETPQDEYYCPNCINMMSESINKPIISSSLHKSLHESI
jgi:hypothetical protein